ncbi:glycosyltransferase family 2 protein [Kineothrix sp. MSJ-39]|uniref:glycosyltransferase family 2 protein n=1 Tax=Kineothrix sp. MSJ-39 TaxID=2841533 RepID=UPI001C1250C2|nr:glycosyltransferase family 2 protein [Kineothrix sp. MSJ-39]MBU5429165.1 glycosyltransferase family 2 protein [Kineothrix sp. MSJ-39]
MSENKDDLKDLLEYYQSAFEREKEKNEQLAYRLSASQREVEDLTRKLDKIKGSIFWKLAKPARVVINYCIATKNRILCHGNPKGIAHKLLSKYREKKAIRIHGTGSFPSAAEREQEENTTFPKDVTFSILVPLYNTPERFLREMIESVIAQTYGKWELCLADGSDDAHEFVGRICHEYQQKDSRIKYQKLVKNEGISGNTNECYKMATGNYIALFDHDDLLHPCVLFAYMQAICEKNADYIYCDEATFKGNSINHMITMHFKPDYAPDNLLANNYICHFSVFSRELLESGELFRSQFDGSQDHDMILRLTAKAKHIVHIPRILYYWRSHKGSVASSIDAKTYAINAAKGAVADRLTRLGYKNFEIESTRAFATIFRIKYALSSHPLISIIIPNKDHMEDLSRCVDSIINLSTYDNYELIIVENNSETAEIRTYYEEISRHPRVQVVEYKGDFNYSKINNFGVQYAKGEYLLLLNNDTEVITPDWMEELLMYAMREDVGVVGAKLYYPDKTIQHAGIVIGLGAHRTAGHTHYRIPEANVGYMGRLCYAQDVTAVTGACMMVSKALYEELGGLDESFTVALNDVDFCLRVREKGFLNIFTPFAELYHYESKSRGSDKKDDKAVRYQKESDRFRAKWADVLAKGDPYYNPNFSLDHSDFTVNWKRPKQ